MLDLNCGINLTAKFSHSTVSFHVVQYVIACNDTHALASVITIAFCHSDECIGQVEFATKKDGISKLPSALHSAPTMLTY